MRIGVLGCGAYGLALTSIMLDNKHEVVLWTRFVEERGGNYKIKQIDEVFLSFYKSVSDPDNDIMDAMKKARLFPK